MTTNLQHLAFWLSSFWAALYALRRFRQRHARASFLPAPSSSSPPTSPELFRSRETRITLRNFHINVQSTAWNSLHQYASARMKRRDRWRSLMVIAYDAGSVLGVLGMLGSIVLLGWSSVQLGMSWYDLSTYTNTHPASVPVHKRDLSTDVPSRMDGGHSAPLHLIIPGITTPLHHLPILLLALLTTQVIHEAGHAVAGALESLSLSSAGVGLTIILPSAFVAFPTGDTESLPLRARLRVITSGAFHNIVFWLLLVAASWIHVSSFIWSVYGYRDVSSYGRVVVHVDEDSALYGYLPIGAVVYKIDDDTLDSGEGASDQWETLLSSKGSESTPKLGWCTEEPWFSAHNSSCCTSKSVTVSFLSCFTPSSDPSFERCVEPLIFLDPDEGASLRRCETITDCGHGQLCVRPRGDQELVALTMHMPPWLRADDEDEERTVVWQGDRSEILHEVEVGDWLPKFSMLPMGLPLLWSTFFMYLKVLTLSLYFFNSVPLPFLDGGQLLDALLGWWMSTPTGGAPGETGEPIALDDLEGGSSASGRSRLDSAENLSAKKSRWKRWVHVLVGILMVSCIVLSLANVNL